MTSGGDNSKPVGLGDIARKAGVTRQTVSLVMRNKPGVGESTRQRVKAIAAEIGYAPDPQMNAYMNRVRETKSRSTLPIAWLNHHRRERDAWKKFKYLTPYWQGAEQRAKELGYHLEEFWTHEEGMTSKRLSEILYQRGIEGVVLTLFVQRMHLDWTHFAGVSLDGFLISPNLPRIISDMDYNLALAYRQLEKRGVRRIGICLADDIMNPVHFTLKPLVDSLLSRAPGQDRIPLCLYPWKTVEVREKGQQTVLNWLQQTKPEVVICFHNSMLEWCQELGIRVPEDMGVVHIMTDDDVHDWAGINSNRRVIGATAIDWLVSQMMNRNYGIPEHAPQVMIRGEWQEGKTLRRE